MEDGLVPWERKHVLVLLISLNPCCNGRWSRTDVSLNDKLKEWNVLILVVMEDGLVLKDQSPRIFERWAVLILVVMEDGLVLNAYELPQMVASLNPCCNGRWSRTYQLADGSKAVTKS